MATLIKAFGFSPHSHVKGDSVLFCTEGLQGQHALHVAYAGEKVSTRFGIDFGN